MLTTSGGAAISSRRPRPEVSLTRSMVGDRKVGTAERLLHVTCVNDFDPIIQLLQLRVRCQFPRRDEVGEKGLDVKGSRGDRSILGLAGGLVQRRSEGEIRGPALPQVPRVTRDRQIRHNTTAAGELVVVLCPDHYLFLVVAGPNVKGHVVDSAVPSSPREGDRNERDAGYQRLRVVVAVHVRVRLHRPVTAVVIRDREFVPRVEIAHLERPRRIRVRTDIPQVVGDGVIVQTAAEAEGDVLGGGIGWVGAQAGGVGGCGRG